MKNSIREKLLGIAKKKISNSDPSHDITHSLRVIKNAEMLAKEEKADLEIIIPAAIFHDVINYPRNNPKSKFHAQESALEATRILKNINEFPKDKISQVDYAIRMHNSKDTPDTIEAKIIQDADNLEVTGAIVVMRMFTSAGLTGRAFYHIDDPWGKDRNLDGSKWTLDYYLNRLLKVEHEMHTATGGKIAKRRTQFLKNFMKELEIELRGE
ncbi:HD domain-containing protein [Patescibacteria group bacterium]